MSCASTNTIAALLAGAVDPAAAARLEVHLDECVACRRLVADVGRGLSAIGEARTGMLAQGLPRPGDSIGRYTIQRLIGVGGMGVVYEAHDTTLDRHVAVKLLRPDLLDGPSLLAEAQAMARLQHPNIATVHDAGLASGQLYVCMEYVAGSTLRSWLAATRRSWRAIVTVYAAAGEGLAYVHRAGLVHLDFKPDNVLIDRDGRVRVTDFGLARIAGARPPRAIVGTPAYMAPEQRENAPTDARSDQYAFCVALREALAGVAVPRWLDRVLDCGLAAHRDDRFASMDELLAAITVGLAPRPRRAVALAVVGASALVALVALQLPAPPAAVPLVIERPVAHTITEYRDRAPAAAPQGDRAPAAARATAPADSLSTPVTAREPSPARRRPPVLHADPFATITFASAAAPLTARASDDAAWPIGISECDDGSPLGCDAWVPTCPAGTLLSIQQGCWTCAVEQTCAALGFPRTCNDGTPLSCNQPAPACSSGRVAAVRNGCWSCEDPFTCWSHATHPGAPPPRPPPRPHDGSGSGSGSSGSSGSGGSGGSAGSGGGATCGNGMCETGEDHASCASDCCETGPTGACLAVCGNGFCETGEDHASCAGDCCLLAGSGGCAPVCGNGFCEAGETAASCPSECP